MPGAPRRVYGGLHVSPKRVAYWAEIALQAFSGYAVGLSRSRSVLCDRVHSGSMYDLGVKKIFVIAKRVFLSTDADWFPMTVVVCQEQICKQKTRSAIFVD